MRLISGRYFMGCFARTFIPVTTDTGERHMPDRPDFGALLIPKRQAFAAIGVGNTKGHELINAGLLVARKLGTRTLIEAESLRSYAASLPALPRKNT